MQLPDSLVIGPTPGYSPAVGRLVAMMSFARMTTLRAAVGLSVAQLDHLHDPSSNSIGALLAHVAAVEVAYQRITFEGRGLSLPTYDEEWTTALQLGDAGREKLRGKPLEHYVTGLEQVREFTLEELARRDDRWLDETDVWNGRKVNNYFLTADAGSSGILGNRVCLRGRTSLTPLTRPDTPLTNSARHWYGRLFHLGERVGRYQPDLIVERTLIPEVKTGPTIRDDRREYPIQAP